MSEKKKKKDPLLGLIAMGEPILQIILKHIVSYLKCIKTVLKMNLLQDEITTEFSIFFN